MNKKWEMPIAEKLVLFVMFTSVISVGSALIVWFVGLFKCG
jgi:hypothetical protein